MHGTNDPVIPISFGEHLFALAHEPKQFVPFAGGGHDDLDRVWCDEDSKAFIGG